MSYSYQVSISEDFPNQKVHSSVLQSTIEALELSSATIQYINTDSDVCSIVFDVEPSSEDMTSVDGVVAAHTGIVPSVPLRVGGGIIIEPLPDISVPTVVPQGTTGSTTWGYKVSALSDTGEALCSSETQIANGAATLSSTDYNTVSWSEVVGAVSYNVYRSTAGGTPSSIGLLFSTSELSYDDKGAVASGSEPSEDLSGGLIVGSGGDIGSFKVVTFKELTSDQSTVTSLLRLARLSTGTPDVGFGSGIYIQLDDSSNVLREACGLHVLWHDPGAALETDFRISLRDGGGGIVERFKFHHDGSIDIKGSPVIDVGTCQKRVPVTGVSYGSEVTISSNNSIVALRFPYNGTVDGYARWNMRPPQNYTSGDLVFRLLVSAPSTIGSSKDTKWSLYWSNVALGESLGSWDYSTTQTIDVSGQASDQLFALDFPITAAQFSASDDLMAFRVERHCTDSADNCGEHIYAHDMELRYTGNRFSGQ